MHPIDPVFQARPGAPRPRPRSSRSRGVASIAGVILALGAVAPIVTGMPLRAFYSVPVDAPEFLEIRVFLKSLGATDDAISEVAGATDADKLADWFRPDLSKPGLRPAGTDLATGAFFEIETTPEIAAVWRSPGGPLAAGSRGVVMPLMPAGRPVENEFYIYATTMAEAPVGQAGLRVEFGLAAFDATPPGGGTGLKWQPQPQSPGDFFAGFNVAWSTRSESGGPFGIHHFQYLRAGSGFAEAKTDAFSIFLGRTMLTFIPASESDGFVSGRAFGFTGSATDQAADTYPDIDQPGKPYAGAPFVEITALPSVPTPTPAPTPTTASGATVAPSASAGATSGASLAPAPSGPAGGTVSSMGVPWLLVAIIGVVIVILGWLLFRGGMAVGGPGPGAKPGQGGAAAPPPQPTRPDPVAVHNAVDALTGRIEDGTFPGSVAEAIDELDALKGQVDAVGRAAWTMGVGTDAGSAAADDRARLDAAIARAKTWVYPTPPPSDILSPSEVDQWNRDQRLIPGSDAYKAAQATWRAKAADVANVAAEAKSVAGSGAAPEVREFAATAEARASALGEAVAKVFP